MPRIGGLASLDNIVPTTRTITTSAPLTGGGDLSVDRTITVPVGTTSGTVASGADPRLTNSRPWSLFTGNPGIGQVPVWNGATFVPANQSASSGGLTVTTTKTAAYTINVGEYVPVNVSGGAVTLTLPNAPTDGARVGWKIVQAGNTLAVACSGSDVFTRPGSGVTSVTGVLLGQSATAQYDSARAVWLIVAGDLPLAQLDARYQAAGYSTPDATTGTKGIVQLAGDLGGNAAAPVVVNGEKTTNKSVVGTLVPNGYIGAGSDGLTPAPLLPSATSSGQGIIALAGDLGGASGSPTIIRRAPVGGIYAPTYAASLTPQPGNGVHMRVSAVSGNLAIGAPAGSGADGQRYLIELQMTGTTNRTITLDPSYELGLNVTSRSIAPSGTATVWVYIGLILRNTTWRVLAVDAGA